MAIAWRIANFQTYPFRAGLKAITQVFSLAKFFSLPRYVTTLRYQFFSVSCGQGQGQSKVSCSAVRSASKDVQPWFESGKCQCSEFQPKDQSGRATHPRIGRPPEWGSRPGLLLVKLFNPVEKISKKGALCASSDWLRPLSTPWQLQVQILLGPWLLA